MHRTLADEVMRLGGDPTDDVWRWLVTRGPHGPSFTWSQTRNEPPGYVGINHLQEIASGLSVSVPFFHERSLQAVNVAMDSALPELVRRAIQVAAVVGGASELQRVKQLVSSADQAVASDAKACAFYLKARC